MIDFRLTRTIEVTLGENAFAGVVGVSDFDKDGRQEVVPGVFSFPAVEFHAPSFFELQENGALTNINGDFFANLEDALPIFLAATEVIVADVNGDGDDDLVIPSTGEGFGDENVVALSDGRGGLFKAGFNFQTEPQETFTAAVGDFDGDGRTDIFWGNLGDDDSFISSVGPRDEVELIGIPIEEGVRSFQAAASADIDGDFVDDLILGVDNNADPEGRSVIARWNGVELEAQDLPVFASLSGRINADAGAVVQDIEVTDLDGDGLKDIVLMATSVAPTFQGFDFQVLLQDAAGGFSDRTSEWFDADDVRAVVPANDFAVDFMFADIDLDGDQDIFLSPDFPAGNRIFYNEGGRFALDPTEYGAGTNGAAVADLDGDGALEIIAFEAFQAFIFDSGLSGPPRGEDGTLFFGKTIDAGAGAQKVIGGRKSDSLDGGAGADTLRARADDDLVEGKGGRDSLFGGGGDDTVDGGKGVDFLRGDGGRDMLFGGNGRDTLAGSASGDLLDGGRGADVLRGGSGEDRLIGGRGPDTLFGGGDDDTLIGGSGPDVLIGGAGADRFVFGPNDGPDVVTDFEVGVDEIDVVARGASFDALDVEQAGADALIRLETGSIRLLGVDVTALTEEDFLF